MIVTGLESPYFQQTAGRPKRYNPASPAEIIHLRERNFIMLKQDLILRNPLRLLGQEDHYILPEGGIGAVLARAGVGKTALMVQLALDTLLREKTYSTSAWMIRWIRSACGTRKSFTTWPSSTIFHRLTSCGIRSC